MGGTMRPARPAVYWDVLVPGRCTQVTSTVAAPAEVLWQLVDIHERGGEMVVILRRIQLVASVAVITTLYTT